MRVATSVQRELAHDRLELRRPAGEILRRGGDLLGRRARLLRRRGDFLGRCRGLLGDAGDVAEVRVHLHGPLLDARDHGADLLDRTSTSPMPSRIASNASAPWETVATPSSVHRAPSSTRPIVRAVSAWVSWISWAIVPAACWDSS